MPADLVLCGLDCRVGSAVCVVGERGSQSQSSSLKSSHSPRELKSSLVGGNKPGGKEAPMDPPHQKCISEGRALPPTLFWTLTSPHTCSNDNSKISADGLTQTFGQNQF